MKLGFLSLVVAASVALLCSAQSWAALTQQSVLDILQKTKVFGGRKLSAEVSGGQVTICATRNQGVSFKDLKIEAVMATKSLIDGNSAVRVVIMRFYNESEPGTFTEVTVTAAEIKAFGGGVVSGDELLESLRVVEGKGSSPLPVSEGAADALKVVAEGPLRAERAALSARISALERKGVGVRPFTQRFLELERLAGQSAADSLKAALETLESSVAAQEAATALPAAGRTTAAAPAPAPAAGPGPDGQAAIADGVPVAGSSSLSTMFNQMGSFWMDAAKFQAEYPWCHAAEGPYRNERGSISVHLFKLKGKGYDITPYKKYFQQMEAYARAKQMDSLRQSIKSLAEALHVRDLKNGYKELWR